MSSGPSRTIAIYAAGIMGVSRQNMRKLMLVHPGSYPALVTHQCAKATASSCVGAVSAKAERISRVSSPGLRPKKRLNSRLNCDALS